MPFGSLPSTGEPFAKRENPAKSEAHEKHERGPKDEVLQESHFASERRRFMPAYTITRLCNRGCRGVPGGG